MACKVLIFLAKQIADYCGEKNLITGTHYQLAL